MMRVAVYWAPPPASLLWQQGCRWLGRDAHSGELLPQPAVPGMLAPRFTELTEDARRYGWHATVRAPFRLRAGVTLEQVETLLRQWLRRFRPIELTLQPDVLAGFCALLPTEPSAPLAELAAALTVALDAVAEAPPAAVQARRAAGLGRREQELDLRWGYPFVFEHYRFHCTLAAAAAADEQQALLAAARAHFGAAVPVRLGGLALFVEPAPGAAFVYRHYLAMEAHDAG